MMSGFDSQVCPFQARACKRIDKRLSRGGSLEVRGKIPRVKRLSGAQWQCSMEHPNRKPSLTHPTPPKCKLQTFLRLPPSSHPVAITRHLTLYSQVSISTSVEQNLVDSQTTLQFLPRLQRERDRAQQRCQNIWTLLPLSTPLVQRTG